MNPTAPVLLVNTLAAIPGQAAIEVDSPLLFKDPADLATLLNDILASLSYQGTWNAATDTPAIPAAASGNNRWYYVVAVAGNTAIDGNNTWNVGDWLISNGSSWVRTNTAPLNLPLIVAQGGTGTSSGFTAFSPLFAGTGPTNAFQSLGTIGTAGQVLASNGAGALSSFQTPLWSWLASTPTTLAGYGITDAATLTTAQTLTNKIISFANNSFPGVANSGANSNITSLAGLTTALSVAQGGTGGTSHLAYAPLCGGTTAGGVLQSPPSAGTAGQIFVSNGPGAVPSFQTALPQIVLEEEFDNLTSTVSATINAAATGTYRAGGWVKIHSVTTDAIELQLSWTDATYSTQTKIFYMQGSTSAPMSAAGFYAYPPMDIHALAGTNIAVSTVYTTSGGSISYDVGCTVMRLT